MPAPAHATILLPLRHAVALLPHPDAPAVAAAVEAILERRPDGALWLRYRLQADPARLRLPAPAPAGQADGLWRHTCLEAFVAVSGQAGYREFNFSPSGQWAMYDFSGYREGMTPFDAPAPALTVVRDDAGLVLEAAIPAASLPPAGAGLCIGLAAVVEARDGSLGYWALRHAPGRPDFHHPEAFAVALPGMAPGTAAPPRQARGSVA